MTVASIIRLGLGDVPTTPPSGYIYIYPKSDGRLYGKDSSGVEFSLGASSAIDWVIGLSTNGLVTKTASGAGTTRTLQAGTGIVVTNGNGVASDPVVALATIGTAGTYVKVTVDAYGRVVSATTLSASDLPQYIGDTGGGGIQGAVPPAAAGDTALGRYLKADGTWQNPIPASLPPSGSAGGSLTGSYPAPTIADGAVTDSMIVDVAYAKLTGAPSSLPPSEAAGGDLTGTYPNPTLTTSGATAGTYTKVTVDAKGRVTVGATISASDVPALPASKIPQAGASQDGYLSQADWATFNAKQPAGNYLTALTGDGSASGPGSSAFTLAASGVTAGTYGDLEAGPTITVDPKGRVTAAFSSYRMQKQTYLNEVITIPDGYTWVHAKVRFSGTSRLVVEGTGCLKII